MGKEADPEDARLHRQFERLEAEDGASNGLDRDAARPVAVELTRSQQYVDVSR